MHLPLRRYKMAASDINAVLDQLLPQSEADTTSIQEAVMVTEEIPKTDEFPDDVVYKRRKLQSLPDILSTCWMLANQKENPKEYMGLQTCETVRRCIAPRISVYTFLLFSRLALFFFVFVFFCNAKGVAKTIGDIGTTSGLQSGQWSSNPRGAVLGFVPFASNRKKNDSGAGTKGSPGNLPCIVPFTRDDIYVVGGTHCGCYDMVIETHEHSKGNPSVCCRHYAGTHSPSSRTMFTSTNSFMQRKFGYHLQVLHASGDAWVLVCHVQCPIFDSRVHSVQMLLFGRPNHPLMSAR